MIHPMLTSKYWRMERVTFIMHETWTNGITQF